MAADLGKAYVQIVPSAKGISGKIKGILGGEAGSAGDAAGKSFSGAFGSVLKKGVAAIGIGAMIGKAVQEGGKLEQAIGGIETLFGTGGRTIQQFAQDAGKSVAEVSKEYGMLEKAQSTALAHAAEAYKTAGLSQTDYMQTVTGFAAALKGSTKNELEAAQVADKTVIQMADNANKMGTDMSSIQDAYAGFAKQNYTMLDNLKLGYGGTRGEMERLLKDAGELSGKKYDINNLKDVYEAIGVIQDDLGITGTTAKEAASTLEGSFASMKAAATNFLGSLSQGEGVAESASSLAESAATFLFDNLVPAIGNVITSLPSAISSFISTGVPLIWDNISSALSSVDPMAMYESIKGKITDAFSNLVEAAPQVAEKLKTMLSTALTTAGTVLPELAQTIFTDLFNTLSSAISGEGQLMATISSAIDSIGSFIAEKMPVVINVIGTKIIPAVLLLLGQLAIIIVKAIPTLLSGAETLIKSLITGLVDGIKSIISDALNALADLVVAAISAIWSDITSVASAAWNGLKKVISAVVKGIVSVVTAAWNAIKSATSAAWNAIKSAVDRPVSAIRSVISGAVAKIKSIWNGIQALVGKTRATFDSIKSAATRPLEAIREKVSNMISRIKGMFPFSVGKIFSGWVPKIRLTTSKSGDSASTNTSVGREGFAKAMHKPYLFKRPTTFYAGEAGDEILYGRRSLLNDIKAAAGNRNNTFNITLNANGGEDPEQYAQRFVRELRREVRMGAI